MLQIFYHAATAVGSKQPQLVQGFVKYDTSAKRTTHDVYDWSDRSKDWRRTITDLKYKTFVKSIRT